MYQTFIGIDIGKMEFFAAAHFQKPIAFPNTPTGFKQFFKQFKAQLHQALVVLETTGGYEMALVRFLQKQLIAVHRANARKVKNFIRSYGILGKSDRIDALALAHYAFERHSSLDLFVPPDNLALLKLTRRHQELTQMLVKEKNRMKAPEQKGLFKSFRIVMKALDQEIKRIEQAILDLIKDEPELEEKCSVLKTVCGIGDKTAFKLIALLPELGKLDRRKIASLASVAPHPNESGNLLGYRRTRGGRVEIKPVLFMAALSASQSHSNIGQAYKRHIEVGKKPMVAMVAIMRKIIVIANARLRDYYLEKQLLLAKHS